MNPQGPALLTACMHDRPSRRTFQQQEAHGHANQHAELADQHPAMRAVGQAPPQPVAQDAACRQRPRGMAWHV